MTLLNNPKQNSYPIAQLIAGRLYFTSFDGLPPRDSKKTYYCIDEFVHYDSFYEDFGPLNLSVLYRFCESLHNLLQSGKKIFLYASVCPKHRVNAVYLIASYMVIYQKLSAEQAYIRIQSAEPPPFIGFRDAALGNPSYLLHVQDVIKSIENAVHFKWLNFQKFDPDEYEFYERVENGDLNWIIPGRILSFCGPHEKAHLSNGYPYHEPETYFEFFRDNNITTIIRLNKKIYDARRFTEAGFIHHDLFFLDGSTPSNEIVEKFITIVDSSTGGVAVHCKAGLGRTGTLIACWMMKNFRLTAPQCMGWLRVCRPGSVIGPQQAFLIDKQEWCWRLGAQNQEAQNQNLIAKKVLREDVNKKLIHVGSAESRQKTDKHAPAPLNDSMELLLKHKDKSNVSIGDNHSAQARSENKNRRRPPPNFLFENCPPTAKQRDKEINDEAAENPDGETQGDRLLEKKAKIQAKKQKKDFTDAEDSTRSLPPRDSCNKSANYSSATTPIKQLKLSLVTHSRSTGHLLEANRRDEPRNSTTSESLISKVTVFTNRPSSSKTAKGIKRNPAYIRCLLNNDKLEAPPSAATEFGRDLNKSFADIGRICKISRVSSHSNLLDNKYDLRPRIPSSRRYLL